MARTIADIEAALDTSITSVISSPSTSQYAEWKLWRSIMARAIWAFEKVMDTFKEEIQSTIRTKQPGSLDWYHDRVLEFQGQDDGSGTFQGDNLVVENGILRYEQVDEQRRIIKQASLRGGAGTLAIKIAKALDESNYQPLTESEQLAFSVYMDNIKYPGTIINVISQQPDLIKYNLQIVYDPIFTLTTIKASIKAKMEEYRASLGFDDRFYPAKMLEKVLEAQGVVSVKNNGVYSKAATDADFAAIDIVYTLAAGYYNYEPLTTEGGASTLTMTNYKTL